jgi:hypothetical protein
MHRAFEVRAIWGLLPGLSILVRLHLHHCQGTRLCLISARLYYGPELSAVSGSGVPKAARLGRGNAFPGCFDTESENAIQALKNRLVESEPGE